MSFLKELVDSIVLDLNDELDVELLKDQTDEVDYHEIASELADSFNSRVFNFSFEEHCRILNESCLTQETILDFEMHLSRKLKTGFQDWIEEVALCVLYREVQKELYEWFYENGITDKFIYTDDEGWQKL